MTFGNFKKAKNAFNRVLKKPYALVLTLILLFFGIFLLVQLIPSRVTHILYLDSMASISLSMDITNRVVAAEAYNSAGEQVLKSVHITNAPKKRALTAILDAMIDKSYLDPNAPDTLFYGWEDPSKTAIVRGSNVPASHSESHNILLKLLEERNCTVTLISYVIPNSTSLERFGEQYGLNPGVSGIIKQNNFYNTAKDQPPGESLTSLYLHWVTRFHSKMFPNIQSQTQRMSELLSPEDISARVIEYLKLTIQQRNITPLELNSRSEDGEPYYLLSVEINGHVYRMQMHAKTGEITNCTQDDSPYQP